MKEVAKFTETGIISISSAGISCITCFSLYDNRPNNCKNEMLN